MQFLYIIINDLHYDVSFCIADYTLRGKRVLGADLRGFCDKNDDFSYKIASEN